MNRSKLFKTAGAMIVLLAMSQPLAAMAAAPMLKIAPISRSVGSRYARPVESVFFLTHAQKLALLQKKIKYVFVLFQENESFDHYFGTYPGAEGLFSHGTAPSNAQVPGFSQPIVNTDGTVGVIKPFLIPQSVKNSANATVPLYTADLDSVDHSHSGYVNALHTVSGVPQNDRYAINAEGFTTDANGNIVTKSGVPLASATPPSLTAKQLAELTQSHVDCDSIPVLWTFADRFTLFDNFDQTITGPSTPNAIAMIAGQAGETQWVLHPGQASNNTANPQVAASGGIPIVGDPAPFPGSNYDYSAIKPPYNGATPQKSSNPTNPTFNQTYATLPLSFMGKQINKTILSDQNPALDLLDVQGDIATIAAQKAVNWGWYQEGYDAEPSDSIASPIRSTYITHHNAPQYFGYIGDNPVAAKRLHGLGDFFNDISAHNLAPGGGVFYVRSGYGNNDNLVPISTSPAVKANFLGSDDHPAYSDNQISEQLIADEVNTIAASPYWKDSVIIIAYDESDGFYDHVSPEIRELDPQGNPLAGGPRIPAILISPYGVAHSISHVRSEHASVIKFIDQLFGLTPLADLPVEAAARQQGMVTLGQPNLGPADDITPDVGDLFEAFDDGRLTGQVRPLPGDYALIPAAALALPHYGGRGCTALSLVPTDYVGGVLLDPAPADFNPRPRTNPGTPKTDATWPTN